MTPDETTILIKVRLNETSKPPMLEMFTDAGVIDQIQVDADTDTTIRWKLEDNMATGRWLAFIWSDMPPGDIFDTPDPKGRWLKLRDANLHASHAGSWRFMLVAKRGNATYSTAALGNWSEADMLLKGHPIIINR